MSNRVPEDDNTKARRAEERAKLTAHRGMATWGEKLVPLGEFRDNVKRYGRALGTDERPDADRRAVLEGRRLRWRLQQLLRPRSSPRRRSPPRRGGGLLPGGFRRLRAQPGKGVAAPGRGPRALDPGQLRGITGLGS